MKMVYKKSLNCLKANKHLLYVLKKADNRLRKAIISNSNSDLVKTIVEIVLNTLQGNHKVTKSHLKALTKNKKALRYITCPKRTINSKRKVLIQKGGFLPILITSLLSGIFGKLLKID